MTPRFRRRALTIRAALIIGFGLVLGLWVLTGYAATQLFSEVQNEASALNERYLLAQDVLATVRVQVLQGAVEVRDALFEPPGANTTDYRRRLDATVAIAERAMVEYGPVFGTTDEIERTAQLRARIGEFRAAMIVVLDGERNASTVGVRDRLNRAVLPPRDAVIQGAEKAQAVNRAAFVEQQRAMADAYAGIQARASQQRGFVVMISFGIALVAVLYSGRLENRLRRKQEEEARTAADLHQLSAKLIRAQEDERRTIARELHDEIGQALMAIKVELAYTQRAIATTGGPSQLLDEAQTITDGVVRSVRDLSQLLHPPLLDDMGLPAAINWYIGGFGRRHPIEIDLHADDMDERLSPEVETAAYRILQEALTNVAKHAGASTCRVHLRRSASTLTLTVEDDGRGFDTAALERAGARRGLGLIGVRERVAQLQGRFTLASSPDAGTRLAVELPI